MNENKDEKTGLSLHLADYPTVFFRVVQERNKELIWAYLKYIPKLMYFIFPEFYSPAVGRQMYCSDYHQKYSRCCPRCAKVGIEF